MATLFVICIGWIWGGWAASAGQSIFALIAGRSYDVTNPVEVEASRLIAIGLMFLSLVIYTIGKKIARTMEIIDAFLVIFTLSMISLLALIFAPASLWAEALKSIVIPAPLPEGIDVATLGSIIGYTGFGAGMNFLLINYYRDHGYGMGRKIGFFSGLVGGQKQEVLPSGVTFPESERNTRVWNRWYHYLKMDQWLVFFTGAMAGMFIPSVLVRWLASQPGAATPTSQNIPVYAATELSKQAALLYPFVLVIGALILFKTQTTILEMLTRNTTDAAIAVNPRLRWWISGDSRRAYYVIAVIFILVISVIIHLALPTDLLIISGNMSNLASIIYPWVLIYLNTKLPNPARAGKWSKVVLVLNVLFFGFFFVNSMAVFITGQPLVGF